MTEDDELRSAAFAYINEISRRNGGLVHRHELDTFTFRGSRIPLASRQRGIWKPRSMDAALSILTTYSARPSDRPYDDRIGYDGYPRYKWQGTDPDASDNRALRTAMQRGKPLVWFVGVGPGIFEPISPVWLVGEEPSEHEFIVALDPEMRLQWDQPLAGAVLEMRDDGRRYADRIVRQRLHQPVFRGRVLAAYAERCAVCHLHHPELLDAAHIRRDADGGQPVIPNGIALCSIHHSAFDSNIVGIRPDYRIEIRPDVLAEEDGPTLKHTLQAVHGQSITVPKQRASWPDRVALEERYEAFRMAS